MAVSNTTNCTRLVPVPGFDSPGVLQVNNLMMVELAEMELERIPSDDGEQQRIRDDEYMLCELRCRGYDYGGIGEGGKTVVLVPLNAVPAPVIDMLDNDECVDVLNEIATSDGQEFDEFVKAIIPFDGIERSSE